MSYAPFPSNDGSEILDPARLAGLRLRDAEKIAADRLETGGDGSLKEALASVDPGDTPPDEVERLTDRIEAARAGYTAAAIESSTLPFLADPASHGAGEALEGTLLGLPEWSDARAAVAAELADMQSQPLFLQGDAQQTNGTYWQPVARDADPYPHPADGVAVQEAAARPEPAVEPPMPEPQTDPVVAPIAGAFDAAAKLAADADAAASALENLTRLLHNHQRPASVIPSPQHLSSQRPPRPAPAAQHQRQAPRPLVAAQKPAARAVTAPALRPAPMLPESRQFDVRGFMAGFALSWAIGAVLYIYLMVG